MSIIEALPKYSIIVRLNERKTFPLCLDAILKQTISKDCYEILLVDGAVEEYIFEGELKKLFFSRGLKYIFKKGDSYAQLNNLAVKAAKGEIIFFTESGCVVPENWLEEFIKCYERHSDIVGVSGWIKAAGGKRKYAQKCLDVWRQKSGANMLLEERKTNLLNFTLSGRNFNMSYQKSALENIKGFDINFLTPEMAANDIEKKIMEDGSYLMHLPLVVNDYGNKNFFDLLKSFFTLGCDINYWGIKYPKNKFLYFRTLPNFVIYLGVNLTEAKTSFFTELSMGLAMFLGTKFVKFFKKPIPILQLESKKEPPKTFEIIKKNQNRKSFTRFTSFDKTNSFLIDSNKFYSIIIPTHNRSRDLINALNHLILQIIPKNKYEIIVINDGSIDNTREVVAEFMRQHSDYDIKYFYQKNAGPSKARNLGIKESKGEIIFFTDDDCTVPPNWMETLLSGLKKHPNAIGAGGWYLPPESDMEKTAGFWQRRSAHYFAHEVLTNPFRQYEILSNDPFRCFGFSAFNTANICYKKSVLEKVGGFKEDFYWPGAEDNELAFRILIAGHSLLYIPFYITHYHTLGFIGFIKHCFHYGANNYFFIAMHRRVFEELEPGFIDKCGSLIIFLKRFLGPEKTLTFFDWLSFNAGIRYMKRALKRNPVFSKPEAKISND